MTAATAHYNPIAKILHWWIAGMIVLQVILAKLAERAEDAGSPLQQLALLANHKSVGITILAVALFRLLWRRLQPPPAPLPMPAWQSTASHISHWTLYALLFLMPLSGWLMSSASAYSVSWFNLVQLPDFVGPDPELKEIFEEIHEALAKLLILLAAVHTAAGLKHAFVNKDGALARISSRMSIAIFAVVLVGGFMSLSNVGKPAMNGERRSVTTAQGAAADSAAKTGPNSELAPWQIDHAASYVRFTGDQAGAKFNGEWQEWQAELRFRPGGPQAGSFDVTVEVASVETGDDDRDDTIVDIDWFDADSFPQVFYRATDFATRDDGSFVANGVITVKDMRSPALLSFTVREADGRYLLDGSATLDRLVLMVGLGEWEDTEWVGQFVNVSVHVEAPIPR